MIRKAAIFLAAAIVTSVFLINFCSAIYSCGCTFLWAGAATHCNIHTGPRHCPWCTIGTSGFTVVFLAILGAQAVAAFGPWALGWVARLGLAVAAFPLAGTVIAVALGLYQGYWQ